MDSLGRRSSTSITGLTDTLETTATPIVTGVIYGVHKSGILGGLELRGGATGAIGAGVKYNLTIYENSARTQVLVEFLDIDNFTQNGIIKDSSGIDINLDLNGILKIYMNGETNFLNELYYKVQCTTGGVTITVPLTFNLVVKTLGSV